MIKSANSRVRAQKMRRPSAASSSRSRVLIAIPRKGAERLQADQAREIVRKAFRGT
jgi:hypothetical protein